MPSGEQLKEAGAKAWEVTKVNFNTLKDAGLFKFEHVKVFAIELVKPLSKVPNVKDLQEVTLAQQSDLTAGFVYMNALALWFEVIGSLFGLLLGNALPLFIFEILYAFAVGYVLYWLVVHAEGRDYKLVAIGLYVLYSLINIVAAVGAIILIVPAVFYFLKTIASLSCAFYAFKIRELSAGAIKLPDEVELGDRVAE